MLYWFVFQRNLKLQNFFIVVASYLFYGWWNWRFLLLIAFTSFCSWGCGLLMQCVNESKITLPRFINVCKLLSISNIVLNLGILGVFKYYNFFVDSFVSAFAAAGIHLQPSTLNIILPVGISFYTFQALSYSIDVYKRKIEPTKDIVAFFAFVSFFPQLVAGPIERAANLLPQFYKKRIFNSENAINGFTLIIYGLFKKIVVADRLAVYVNSVFNNIEGANTLSLTIAAIFFSFQIYCDFSGYSTIARGTAKLFGFELMINFNKPYLATSIPDFWRRWHISLSTWFRDYVYIPLGGNRVTLSRNCFNLMVVFLVSGLWHGANITFIIWGGLHGVFQVISLLFKRMFRIENTNVIFRRFISIAMVFVLVTFSWMFFRAESLNEAQVYFAKMMEMDFTINSTQLSAAKELLNFAASFFVIILIYLSYILPNDMQFKKRLSYILFNIITILIIILLGMDGKSEFIYFQF
ncbi:MAG: MBOAT family protein [Cytophagaceae bacterium]|nr:MBOAT family protein [Cytophagaceae bacterium]